MAATGSAPAERTLVLVKPDGVQRGLVGEIVARLERRGLKLVALKLMQLPSERAARHYAEHQGKVFYEGLIRFITSGPIVAMVWQGREAVTVVRSLMGATDPLKAAPGTVRGDLALDLGMNVIHGSDSTARAGAEIALFFEDHEIHDYERTLDRWIRE
ncbi:MAG: nucleoside-diphosphate kinase [Chloroflexi bacterium]|nr:MAG: nucleoside-diphosphate kinase [Chloroflexota bacterium]